MYEYVSAIRVVSSEGGSEDKELLDKTIFAPHT